jgi:signal transduction histidine kinase
MMVDTENLNLFISDDGAGMDADSNVNDSGHGLGLIGMRERIQALNGIFSYETSSGKGFRIFIHIPHNTCSITPESNP